MNAPHKSHIYNTENIQTYTHKKYSILTKLTFYYLQNTEDLKLMKHNNYKAI